MTKPFSLNLFRLTMNVMFSVTGSLMRIPAGATQWEDVLADCSVSLAQLKLRAHLPGGAKILADDISAASFRHRQSGKKVQWSVNGQEAYYLHCRNQEDADQFASVLDSVRGVSLDLYYSTFTLYLDLLMH